MQKDPSSPSTSVHPGLHTKCKEFELRPAIVMWKTLQQKKDAQPTMGLKLCRSLKKSWGGDWNTGRAHYCLNVINPGRVWFMKLAKVESWNYFLDIKINPRSISTFISRCKEESLASLAKTLLNPHFRDRIFFSSTIVSQEKVYGEKRYQEWKS